MRWPCPGEAKQFRHLDLRVPNSQPRRARNRSDWRTSSDNCLASGNEMAMARHPFSTATQMVTYPIGTISEQLACRRNISAGSAYNSPQLLPRRNDRFCVSQAFRDAPWFIDHGGRTLQHLAKLTQYLGIIGLVIDRNGDYFSRLLVLPVILVRPGFMVHNAGIPWIPHISRQENLSVPYELLERWIGRSYP